MRGDKYTKESPMRVIELCSGYGSQRMALQRLKESHPGFDYEVVAICEIDKNALAAYQAVHGDCPNLGDLAKADWGPFVGKCDLLTYSTPCFKAGTMVRMRGGERRIEDVAAGDLVYTHLGRLCRVVKTGAKRHRQEKMVVRTAYTDDIHCTKNHPFYCREIVAGALGDPQWVEARDLSPDRHMVALSLVERDVPESIVSAARFDDGIAWIPLRAVQREREEYCVYNMEVDRDHSYVANGLVVHNCQSVSVAGKQAGLVEGSGSESSLIWEVRRAIDALRPKYLLFENVANILSRKHVGEFVKWCRLVESFGYDNFYKVLDASDYGVPQHRERVFMVSILKDEEDRRPLYSFPKPRPLEKRLYDCLEEYGSVPEEYYYSPAQIAKIIHGTPADTLRKSLDNVPRLFGEDFSGPGE